MAIKKTLTMENNFGEQSVFNDCYIKVSSVSVTQQNINATVVYMRDKMGKILNTETFYFTPDLQGENFIKQAYQYIKTLPKFSGSVDC